MPHTPLIATLTFPLLATTALAQPWYWPPQDIDFRTQCVAFNGRAILTVGGQWPSSCIPYAISARVLSGVGRVDVEVRARQGICLTVISPWSLRRTLWPLNGEHEVFITLVNQDGVVTFPAQSIGRVSATTQGCVADIASADGGSCTPDGGVTIEDLLLYLEFFAAGDIAADVDDATFTGTPDDGVTIDDLVYYLNRYQQGC